MQVRISSRRYSRSRSPYARRWITRIILLSSSTNPRAIIRSAAVRGTGLRRTVERAIVAVAASLAWITAAAAGMEAAAKPLSADAQLERAIALVRRGARTSAIGEI